jgi:hypothetical protein
MAYAEKTTVSPEKSKAEIETLLRRYGADQFVSGWDSGRALIGFRAANRHVRFELIFPDPKSPEFQSKRRTHRRSRYNAVTQKRETFMVGASGDRYEAEVRRRWRALALVIKAKLEAVASGIVSFETEFMAHIVLPDGRTIGQHVSPAIEAAYSSGKMSPLLPAFTGDNPA